MTDELDTRQLAVQGYDGLEQSNLLRPVDLLVASVGYEQRARHVSSVMRGNTRQGWAATFETHRVLSFEENLTWFQESDFEIVDANTQTYRKLLTERLTELSAESVTGSLRVAVDISSMTRRRIAETLLSLADVETAEVQVEWFYAPAEYSEHAGEQGPIIERGALPGFEGWSIDPLLPTTLVLGLGYERHTAVGVAEMLEPVRIWAYRPLGVDRRYDLSVADANAQLVPLLSNGRFIDYDVMRPYATYSHLEQTIHGLQGSSRPVIVPLGPKIFALVSLLVASVHGGSTSVWRISADYERVPVERTPTGQLCMLSTVFSTSEMLTSTAK